MDLSELRQDIQDALDHLGSLLLRTRDALLAPYREWPETRPLGPPSDLGASQRSDEFPLLLQQVSSNDLPTRHLLNVQRTAEDFTSLVGDYARGRFSGQSFAWWRTTVEPLYGDATKALDAAHRWLENLATTDEAPTSSRRRPEFALLDTLEMLDTEQLARVLGVVPEVARRRRKQGEFGPTITSGRRKFVRAEGVRSALGLGRSASGI
jgi:hypothetical protein